jgi:glucose/arabinose dehydrogenase
VPLRACLRIALVTSALAAGCGSGNSGSTQSASPDTGASTATTQTGTAHDTRRKLRLVRLGSYDAPVYVGAPVGDTRRVFVVERAGRIRVIRGGKRLSRPFLDIVSDVTSGGEQGLLSVAFAPDYATSRRFYVYYTDKNGDERIVEYRRSSSSADVADRGSARLLLKIADSESNHNGGQLQFGPDKLLYIGTGDGGGADDQHGSRGNGQNRDTLLGKILRIDPDPSDGKPYGIPSDNPYATGGGRAEIYSYGLRNPWRFAFDPRSGAIAIGDVGQNNREEIDYRAKGGARGVNFGWRPWEGTRHEFPDEEAPGHVKPVLEYDHDDDGFCSIIGGYFIRDKGLAGYAGRYIFGDYCKGDLYLGSLREKGSSARNLGLHVSSLTSFGEDGLRRIYAMSEEGGLYRLAD